MQTYVCMLNVIKKLFEKALIENLTSFRCNIETSQFQFGFWKNKSTSDAINKLIKELSTQREIRSSDMFYNLWWPILVKGLSEMETPKHLCLTINSYLKNILFAMTASGKEFIKIPTKGCLWTNFLRYSTSTSGGDADGIY